MSFYAFISFPDTACNILRSQMAGERNNLAGGGTQEDLKGCVIAQREISER